jgi:hypothetical protein
MRSLRVLARDVLSLLMHAYLRADTQAFIIDRIRAAFR